VTVVPFDRPGLKEPSWENFVVGEEFGPLEVVISDHAVKSHVYALDDYHPWYLRDSPPGGPIAPSTLLTRALLDLIYLEYDATRLRALHVREEVQLFGTVRVGQRVTLRARVIDKLFKRGERYIVLAAEAAADDGEPLIRAKQTELFRTNIGGLVGRHAAAPKNGVVVGATSTEMPIVERATHSVEVGSVLPSINKQITLEQMFVFSFGVPNIHTDRAIASESGLAGPIAQGLMSTGYLSQLLANFFGIDWFETGWTSHAFVRPVSPGDTLTVQGRIQDKRVEANGTRLVLEVWCRNQRGDLTTVGTASALVRERGMS
jgi:acyl dehydratase